MTLLAAGVTFFAGPPLAFTPFLQPLKIWDYWPWLLLPLCFGVSLVYKCVRVDSVRQVPIEAAKATFWIVAGMAAAAAALLLLVQFMAR
jgi:hypothetical protein